MACYFSYQFYCTIPSTVSHRCWWKTVRCTGSHFKDYNSGFHFFTKVISVLEHPQCTNIQRMQGPHRFAIWDILSNEV